MSAASDLYADLVTNDDYSIDLVTSDDTDYWSCPESLITYLCRDGLDEYFAIPEDCEHIRLHLTTEWAGKDAVLIDVSADGLQQFECVINDEPGEFENVELLSMLWRRVCKMGGWAYAWIELPED